MFKRPSALNQLFPRRNRMKVSTITRSQLVAANLIVVFSAGLLLGGCKHSASSAGQPQTSAGGVQPAGEAQPSGSAQPSGASATPSNGDQPGSLADRLKAVQDQAAQSSATNAQGGASNSILQKAAAAPPRTSFTGLEACVDGDSLFRFPSSRVWWSIPSSHRSMGTWRTLRPPRHQCDHHYEAWRQ